MKEVDQSVLQRWCSVFRYEAAADEDRNSDDGASSDDSECDNVCCGPGKEWKLKWREFLVVANGDLRVQDEGGDWFLEHFCKDKECCNNFDRERTSRANELACCTSFTTDPLHLIVIGSRLTPNLEAGLEAVRLVKLAAPPSMAQTLFD